MKIRNSSGGYTPTRLLGAEEQKRRRSRSEIRAQNNLGFLNKSNKTECQVYRNKLLATLDNYYENTQYNHLKPWETVDSRGQFIPLHERKPKIIYAYARNLASRVGAKIVAESTFPAFKIEDSPDDQEFIRTIVKISRLKAYLIEPIRRAINTGSVFVRFKIEGGKYKIQWYHSKFCYPTFQENDELETLTIKYIFDSKTEKDHWGNPKKKWYKLELNTEKEILFDNPDYDPESDEEPEFKVVAEVEHGMGFVQGEWITTSENSEEDDGYGLITDIRDFIDELNYSISGSSRSTAYNQDPQLTFTNVDEDEVSNLIKSVTKSWNLGKDGKAEYLESNLEGVKTAIELRDKVINHISDISRTVILNPEKVVAAAQSGRAMEILSEPLIELVDELRSSFDIHFKNLVLKMAFATVLARKMGIDVPIEMPEKYFPTSLDIELKWPPIIKQTIEDLGKKVGVANTAASGNIISRKTALKFVAEDFGVEDIDAEIAEINAQPIFNPFGGGF